MRIVCAIIAGGHSSRMGGGEKCFLEVGGKRIIDRIMASLVPQASVVAISANSNPERFAEFGLPVLPDRITGRNTPLSGIHACLDWAANAGHREIMTVTSDSPFLPANLAERLSVEAKSHIAGVAVSGGQAHYITGIWRTPIRHDLQHYLIDLHERQASRWAERIGAALVEWSTDPFDPFFNINTPEDLAEAERIAAEFNP